MFFNDIERHHLPHIHAEYQGQVGLMPYQMECCLLGNCLQVNTSLLLHGLKFTRMISSPTGSLR